MKNHEMWRTINSWYSVIFLEVKWFEYFTLNDKRLKKQQKENITVIIGNTPYSAGQSSVNNDNKKMNMKN